MFPGRQIIPSALLHRLVDWAFVLRQQALMKCSLGRDYSESGTCLFLYLTDARELSTAAVQTLEQIRLQSNIVRSTESAVA